MRDDKNFVKGDYLFIQKTVGEGAGSFEVNIAEEFSGSTFQFRYPLLNDYPNGFYESSQVVKILQHSKITIEEDVNLFHKPLENGTGGVVVLLSNGGFEIKGYIADKTLTDEDLSDDGNSTNSKRTALVTVLASYNKQKARKVVDFKFTRTFPMIALPIDKKVVLHQEGIGFAPDTFQHITIPPDLNIHLTKERGEKDHRFLGISGLLNKEGFLKRKYEKLLTVVFPPINSCPVFTNKKYGACLVVAQTQLPHWNANTHYTLELFAIKNDKVRIPRGLHSRGELGGFFPYPYSVMSKTFDEDFKRGKYFIQPFVVVSHEEKDPDSVEIYFGDKA